MLYYFVSGLAFFAGAATIVPAIICAFCCSHRGHQVMADGVWQILSPAMSRAGGGR